MTNKPLGQKLIARVLLIAAATTVSLIATTAHAGNTNVGVSVSVSQPGFYGRVDIGDQPPAVLYPQPIIIQQTPVAIHQRPIYLRVPPGHSKDWARYCNSYRACGQPVYFVRDAEPRHYEREERREWNRHDDDRDERHDHRDHDDDRGRSHGRGHGHGHDRD
jgi:hypothetical protein